MISGLLWDAVTGACGRRNGSRNKSCCCYCISSFGLLAPGPPHEGSDVCSPFGSLSGHLSAIVLFMFLLNGQNATAEFSFLIGHPKHPFLGTTNCHGRTTESYWLPFPVYVDGAVKSMNFGLFTGGDPGLFITQNNFIQHLQEINNNKRV